MNELFKQIITYSAAEQLAKDDEFRNKGIEPYMARAKRYYDGFTTVFNTEEKDKMRLQELMLRDEEATILDEHPELRDRFAASDKQQLVAATGRRNLDYFLENGVEYYFDKDRINTHRHNIDMGQSVSTQLMRERLIGITGLSMVRINVVYHDMMDHLWGITELRNAGFDERYKDFSAETGYPFTGFLFSKQSELLSGIGYNTRRFTTNPDHYGSMGISIEAINKHLSDASERDERVAAALEKINRSSEFAKAAGFVINGALGSLLLQRSRDGAVKRMVNGPDGLAITNEPEPLTGPRYLALVIEGTHVLLSRQKEYEQKQLDLNLTIESLLREYLDQGTAVGNISLDQNRDFSNIPESVRNKLIRDAGVSNSYYKR